MTELNDKNTRPEIENWNYAAPWYHGSPLRLEVLRASSTITQNEGLARVFSHKPQIVSIDDSGPMPRIFHNGNLPGFLYRVGEPLTPADVYPHPNSSMQPGLEWITRRPLQLFFIGPVEIDPTQFLSTADIDQLLGGLAPR